MKILCVADHIDPLVYSPQIKNRFADIDFVISCGDLRFHYYDFIVSSLNKPLYFVFGNHRLDEMGYYNKKYRNEPAINFMHEVSKYPGGNIYIDSRVVIRNNVILAGLGGSRIYNGGKNQFTEFQMMLKIVKLIPGLLWNKLRRGRYLDILVTHAPPFGVQDKEDPCHQGFRVFRRFLKWFKPRYLIHGHIHLYNRNETSRTVFLNTTVVNAYNHTIVELHGE
ncbi:MAG: metallophosphoesterase [Spirochaetales bacterium]|nr:metallophosphoesterase [Spirochaetales bacterium]